MSQRNILISACLLGDPVRYNGTGKVIQHSLIQQWQKENRLLSVCPEIAGGMSTPRAPAEIIAGNGATVLSQQSNVLNNEGHDVTDAFILGAKQTLQLAKQHHCIAAILTERSPSCGSHFIYDGSFSGTKISGMGVTAALLEENGIAVFNQNQLDEVDKLLREI